MQIFRSLSSLGISLGGGRDLAGGYSLSLNSSGTTWNFETPLTWLVVGSMRMVYANFHRPIYPRKFSMIAEIRRDGLDFPNAISQDRYKYF